MTTIESLSQKAGRIGLGAILATAGIGHMTFQRNEFQAQVPEFVPLGKDATVLGSGIVEVGLGTALIALPRQRWIVGRVAAAFFVAVFPGNIHQYRASIDAFGLNTDRKRLIRLFGQPMLVAWALSIARSGR